MRYIIKPTPEDLDDALSTVEAWLDDDENLRIPMTPWGSELYHALRVLVAATHENEGGKP